MSEQLLFTAEEFRDLPFDVRVHSEALKSFSALDFARNSVRPALRARDLVFIRQPSCRFEIGIMADPAAGEAMEKARGSIAFEVICQAGDPEEAKKIHGDVQSYFLRHFPGRIMDRARKVPVGEMTGSCVYIACYAPLQEEVDSTREFVTEITWEHRKAFVGFSSADETILRELRPIALHYVDEVMDELYARWLQFPELRRFFPNNATLTRVKGLQREYFLSLTGGEYGSAYLAYRLRVGAVHKRIGLTPEWYMGAYSIYLELILPRVLRAFEYDRIKQARAVTALTKLITLDQQIALAAYIAAPNAESA